MLVDAVAEAHQAERVVLVLGAGDIFGDALGPADFAQHVERRFVRAAMRGAPQAGDTRRDAGEGVGTRRAGEANRSEEHTSELQSLMRLSSAVFCLNKKTY